MKSGTQNRASNLGGRIRRQRDRSHCLRWRIGLGFLFEFVLVRGIVAERYLALAEHPGDVVLFGAAGVVTESGFHEVGWFS